MRPDLDAIRARYEFVAAVMALSIYSKIGADHVALLAYVSALESERDRLRAALEPFAKMRRAAKGKALGVGIGTDDADCAVYGVDVGNGMMKITAGDFDRAVAALEATNG